MISSSAAIPNRRDWTRNNMIMVGIMTNAKRSASPTLVPDRASHKRRIAIDPSVEAIITAPSQGSCCRICSHNKALIWSGVAFSGGASGAGPKSAAATPGKKKKRPAKIGRASGREREGQAVWITGVAEIEKKKIKNDI